MRYRRQRREVPTPSLAAPPLSVFDPEWARLLEGGARRREPDERDPADVGPGLRRGEG